MVHNALSLFSQWLSGGASSARPKASFVDDTIDHQSERLDDLNHPFPSRLRISTPANNANPASPSRTLPPTSFAEKSPESAASPAIHIKTTGKTNSKTSAAETTPESSAAAPAAAEQPLKAGTAVWVVVEKVPSDLPPSDFPLGVHAQTPAEQERVLAGAIGALDLNENKLLFDLNFPSTVHSKFDPPKFGIDIGKLKSGGDNHNDISVSTLARALDASPYLQQLHQTDFVEPRQEIFARNPLANDMQPVPQGWISTITDPKLPAHLEDKTHFSMIYGPTSAFTKAHPEFQQVATNDPMLQERMIGPDGNELPAPYEASLLQMKGSVIPGRKVVLMRDFDHEEARAGEGDKEEMAKGAQHHMANKQVEEVVPKGSVLLVERDVLDTTGPLHQDGDIGSGNATAIAAKLGGKHHEVIIPGMVSAAPTAPAGKKAGGGTGAKAHLQARMFLPVPEPGTTLADGGGRNDSLGGGCFGMF